VIAARNLLNCW